MQDAHVFHASISNIQLHEQVSNFWQQENITNDVVYTIEEAECERHFFKNVILLAQGKFAVKLPVKKFLISKLGNFKEIALRRLMNLEKRFEHDSHLKDEYSRFIQEYLSLGHMRKVDASLDKDSTYFYLPHHCVYKRSEEVPKIRVVFDASCKTSTGLSLNDALMIGPVVQQDLISILMRFRMFAVAFVADIVKMYRQVLIHPSQIQLQRILWRNNADCNIDVYELLTVTYGTSSASYLATRCLKYLAELYAVRFPVGAKHVQRDVYVDDLLTGADTVQDAMLIRDEVIQLLKLGSFELSKWASNEPTLLENINSQRIR